MVWQGDILRKGLTILGIIFIIIVVFGEFVFPRLATSTLQARLENQLASSDVELALSSAPECMIALGRIDTIHAVAHDARLGEVRISELAMDGKKIHLDLRDLLENDHLALQSAENLELKGIITEENLRVLISRKVEQLENVEVRLSPQEALVTAQMKVFGRVAEAELRGIVLEDSGSLYFRMTSFHVRNVFPGKLDLGNFFGDIPLVKPEKLPLGARFDEVVMQDGCVTVSARIK